MKIVAALVNAINDYGNYVRECYQCIIEHYSDVVNDPLTYLQKLIGYSLGHNLLEGCAPSTTYFCIRSNHILGAIRLRHGTNDYIHNVIGHAGYETRLSERDRSVAKHLFYWVKNTQLPETSL